MEAVEFLKERKRMCSNEQCRSCDIEKRKHGVVSCEHFVSNFPEEAVSIVEKWSKKNPVRSYETEFLKVFPKTRFDEDYENICVADVFAADINCSLQKDCKSCWKTKL